MLLALTILRYAVFAAVAFTALAALGVMAVQHRKISPFGRTARTIRRMTDPMLKPIERRVLRSGGNPQTAPWWMIGVAVLGGILTITSVEWVVGQTHLLLAATQGGTRSLVNVILDWSLGLLKLALIIRVIGSWFGMGAYSKWIRPFYLMTEWFLAPLRRILPTIGPIDISPVVAFFLIDLVVRPLLGALLRLIA